MAGCGAGGAGCLLPLLLLLMLMASCCLAAPGPPTQDHDPGHNLRGANRRHYQEQLRTKQIQKQILDGLGLEGPPQLPDNMTTPDVKGLLSTTPSPPQKRFGLPASPGESLWGKPPLDSPWVSTPGRERADSGDDKDQLLKSQNQGPNPTTIYSEAAGDDRNKQALQFHLGEGTEKNNNRVTEAYLMVLVCYKKQHKGKKNRSQRVMIRIYQLHEAPESEEPITTMDVMVRHTKWQKMLLPTTVVQEAMDSLNRTLRLRVVCEDCNKDIQLVMVHKAGGKRHTRSSRRDTRKAKRHKHPPPPINNERNRRSYSKRRPYLILHTASKSRRLRKREVSSTYRQCSCSEVTEFIDFKEFGWDSWIVSPTGFYQTYCVPDCTLSTHSVPTDSNSKQQSNLLKKLSPKHLIVSRDTKLSTELQKQQLHQDIAGEEQTEGSSGNGRCCQAVPSSPLRLVYYDNSRSITTATIPYLIAHSCGCP